MITKNVFKCIIFNKKLLKDKHGLAFKASFQVSTDERDRHKTAKKDRARDREKKRSLQIKGKINEIQKTKDFKIICILNERLEITNKEDVEKQLSKRQI